MKTFLLSGLIATMATDCATTRPPSALTEKGHFQSPARSIVSTEQQDQPQPTEAPKETETLSNNTNPLFEEDTIRPSIFIPRAAEPRILDISFPSNPDTIYKSDTEAFQKSVDGVTIYDAQPPVEHRIKMKVIMAYHSRYLDKGYHEAILSRNARNVEADALFPTEVNRSGSWIQVHYYYITFVEPRSS